MQKSVDGCILVRVRVHGCMHMKDIEGCVIPTKLKAICSERKCSVDSHSSSVFTSSRYTHIVKGD